MSRANSSANTGSDNEGRLRIILVVLAIAIIGGWLYTNLEKVTIETNTGFTGEAKRNPWLAAQRFVESFDMPTQRIGNLFQHPEFPETNGVLFFSRGLNELSRGRGEKLLNWVEEGGHLITVTQFIDDDEDVLGLNPVLDKVGIYGLLEDSAAFFDNDIAVVIGFDDSEREIKFKANPAKVLASNNPAVDYALGTDNADFILSAPQGQGRITVLSETRLFHNAAIDELDHAELLWRLINLHSARQQLWIISGVDMPPLYRWLWQQMPRFMVLAAVILVFWLFHRAQRFGPILPEPPLQRRRILEHVSAVGRYYWDRGLSGQLLDLNRRRIWRILLRRYPDLVPLRMALEAATYPSAAYDTAQQRLYERLSSLVGEVPDHLQNILEDWQAKARSTSGAASDASLTKLRADQFTRHMQHLQSLRNRL